MKNFCESVAECLVLAQNCNISMYEQNHHEGLRLLKLLSNQLVRLSQDIPAVAETLNEIGYIFDMNQYGAILTGILDAQDIEDYILVADLLSLQLMPFLYELQQALISLGVLLIDDSYYGKNIELLKLKDATLATKLLSCKDSQKVIVEPTSSGYLTMQVTDATGSYYFHSNVNPYVAAQYFAKQYYNKDQERYTVLGLGLGYHIKEMLSLDDGIYIDIIEPDLEVIKCAFEAVDLSWLLENERIHLYFDSDFQILKEKLKGEMQFVIHQPSLRHIQDEKMRLAIEKVFIRDSGMRNFSRMFYNNFRENLKNCSGYVDELEGAFKDKNAIIVAAGPSLDLNIELLKEKPENTIVVAVGTVFKKLIKQGISPDYVVFLDAQKHMVNQIKDVENLEIPIIVAASACKGLAAGYKGAKYLVCQNGYDRAEEYAREHGYKTYETGGSVSTIALDICLQLGCKEIAYIGLDLAYTGGVSHASSTNYCAKVETNQMIMVDGYNGDKVPATKLFIIYREWIEKRASLEDAKGRVIDATEGGAYKKNLIKKSLRETFEGWK